MFCKFIISPMINLQNIQRKEDRKNTEVTECLRNNLKLARWAERKYKRFRRKPNDAYKWLVRVASRNPALFYHWQHGVKPNRLKPFG